jgi:hypothetical protein
MKKTFKSFIVSALIGGLAILGSSCGDSSDAFDNSTGTNGSAVVESESTGVAGRYSGELVLRDGRVISSDFNIDETGDLDGSFTIDTFGAVKSTPNSLGGLNAQATDGDETGARLNSDGFQVPSGTYTLDGAVGEDSLSAAGLILRDGVERGDFYIELISGFTRFSFDCSPDPVTGLSPCPSEEDIQYFFDHLRIGSHRHPGRGR